MQQHNSTHPLLFWQIALLFGALGTIVPICGGLVFWAAGLLALACLLKKSSAYSLKKAITPFLLYLMSFGLGFAAATASSNEAPPLPSWVKGKEAQRIVAKVDQVDAMPEGRLRIILSEVTSIETQEVLPGKLAWTWVFPPDDHPLPGETIKTELVILEVHAMANPGSFSIEDYWLKKGVAFRSWTRGDKTDFESLTPPPFWHPPPQLG